MALIGGYDRLTDSAETSPIVSMAGSRDQYTGAVAVFYRF
ncbi:MAG: MipA/OmpV family protein [Brevundimonas sp.]